MEASFSFEDGVAGCPKLIHSASNLLTSFQLETPATPQSFQFSKVSQAFMGIPQLAASSTLAQVH
jgi:hypothetical protein